MINISKDIYNTEQLEAIPESVRLYTVTQVADILQTSKAYVYRLINCGLLKTIKLGKLKIRHDTLAEFLIKAEGMDFSDPSKIYQLRTA